jgi:membrane AbrB-like protein
MSEPSSPETLSPKNRVARERAATLGIAGGGALAFLALSGPLPMLLGPMTACLLAALLGARLRDMGLVSTLMRTMLGVAAGSAVTPELGVRLPDMLLTAALVPVFIVVLAGIGYPFFRHAGFDHPTAYYAAMPGGFQEMLVFGEEAGAKVRALALIHATRVLVIVSLAPLIISWLWGLPLDRPPGAAAASVPWRDMALMAVAAVAGWRGAKRVGLFGATILGPMILTAALSLSGLLGSRPPAEVIYVVQFFIGLAVGVRYVGTTLSELRHDVTASLLYCIVMAVVTLAFVELIIWAGLAPSLDAFLAFAPGGQAEMVVLALIVGGDVAFVVTHHVLRIILVVTLAPVFARLWRRA